MSIKINSALFDLYIPANIKNRNDFNVLTKAKILMALYFSTVIIVAFMLIFLLLVIPTSNANWIHGLSASLLALVLLSFQILVFYKSENIYTSAIIFSMMFFTLSFCAVIVTGGWHSPVLLLFFCSPVVSFLVGGRSEGLYIAALVFICGTALMIAYQMDFTQFQIIAEENMEKIRFGIWIASISLIVACLTTYDFLLEHASKSKIRDRNQ